MNPEVIEHDKVIYFVKRPDEKGRASFSVIKKTYRSNEKPKFETCRNETIASVNESFRSGVLDRTTAEMEITRLCDGLNSEERKRSRGVWVSSDANLKLLAEYWEKEYEDRKIRRPDSAKHRLAWAIDLIGPTSLMSERRELQKVVDVRCAGNPRKQRRACSILNQMRKWFGMKERLRLEKKVRPKFKYLTEAEFYAVLGFVETSPRMGISQKSLKALFEVLFASGARVSEAFSMNEMSYRGKALRITNQLDRQEREVETKTGRVRSTILFARAERAFKIWATANDRNEVCRNSIARLFREACKKAFPKRPDKWVSARDLRHSFAVKCLTEHELSIDTISRLLGNSVTVCEEYYLNFVPENDWLQSVLKKVATGSV